LISSEIFNAGLKMALEFGPNLNKPIQERIMAQFNAITKEAADTINQVCYQARDEGHHFIYSKLGEIAAKSTTISSLELETQFNQFILAKYLWINAENLGHLYSQGCYYAWKDGYVDVIKE
jgi:hypothetical protein